MKKEMTMKEKRFSFLPTRKKEKRKADTHLAHCLLPDKPTLRKSQRAKSFLHANYFEYMNNLFTFNF